MRKLGKRIAVNIMKFSELAPKEKKLLMAARVARDSAQAPYSKYWVGAAVRSNHDTIHTGCNVERCSWTQTTHAEQGAVDSMVRVWGPAKIAAVAIVGAPEGKIEFHARTKTRDFKEISAPSCGHCLQIIWENCYADPNVKLIWLASTGEIMITTMGEALPLPFGPEDLGIDYSRVGGTRHGA
jgi:cytidine deaminase